MDQRLNLDLYDYKNFVRLSLELFIELVERVGPITYQNNNFCEPLPSGLKIAIIPRYLATWDCYKTLMYGFRMAYNTTSLLLTEVCEIVHQVYKEEQLNCPTTQPE